MNIIRLNNLICLIHTLIYSVRKGIALFNDYLILEIISQFGILVIFECDQ
jgi:hypothetical protein